ncbi:actin-binding WH2 domain-containing protein [Candidatus Gracilibacteria bacterium]|nr:actin-binding WH2 domain-containing protein [Candidatus Gracilibacteria bacterium]NJP21758.1 actin-binding WH2 domain-containing protein [Hydrococcus sp. CRU_1_1]
MNYFAILISFLRDRTLFLEEIQKGIKLEEKIFALLICNSVFFAIYGSIIGSSHSWMQLLSSGIKLPALYLLTLIICLPTLFFFDIISGSKFNFLQYFALLLSSMSVISVMLFGFAPIALFFRLSTNDYYFFQLLNIIIFTITGVIGVNFFYQSVLKIPAKDDELPKFRKNVIRSWLVLYGFVGSQLGWTLRPFFGSPDEPFAIFRKIESNFYLHSLQVIGKILGFN